MVKSEQRISIRTREIQINPECQDQKEKNKMYVQQGRSHKVLMLDPLIWSEFPDSQREKGNKISHSGLTVMDKRMKKASSSGDS